MADEATDNGTEELSTSLMAAPPPEEEKKSAAVEALCEEVVQPTVAAAEEEDHNMQEERDNDDAAAAEVFAGYSLQSAGIRFRGPRSGGKVRVFEDQFHTQLVLKEFQNEADDGKIQMELKEAVETSHALSFLRAIYSVVGLFMGGFLFIMGFDILLFLFIHLTTVLKDNETQIGTLDFVASLCSVPVFIYALAFAMTLVTRFVVDTFYGHPFLRSFGLGIVFTEWMAFIFYLGVPMLAFIITLFMGRENFWETSLLTWFSSVLTFWCIFSVCVLWFEVTQCLELESYYLGNSGMSEEMGWREKSLFLLRTAKDATRDTMRIRLSGTEAKYKKQNGNKVPDDEDRHNRCPVGPFSLLTKVLPCYKQFDEEGQKKEIKSLGEVLSLTSYVTRYSWSLDKLFCRTGRQTSSIYVTSGDSRVTERQINSSIVCRIIADVLIGLLVIGLLLWLSGTTTSGKSTTAGLVLVGMIFLAVVTYVAYATYDLKKIAKDVKDQSGATWFRFWQVKRINEPTDGFIWFSVAVQVAVFYLFPLISLCVQQNTQSACLFAFLGLFSFIRHYLNGATLLQAYEHNFFEMIQYSTDDISEEERAHRKKLWKRKSRTYNMLNIGIDSARKFWTIVYSVLVLFFVFVVLMAVAMEGLDHDTCKDVDGVVICGDGSKSHTITPIEGFYYANDPDLPYPTCVLRVSEFDFSDNDLTDYAFISNLAYMPSNNTEAQEQLNLWYGNDTAIVNDTLIQEFRRNFPFEELGLVRDSPVSYKLIQSVIEPSSVIITIRGTATPLDVMTDAQIWISAVLFQLIRELLPLGTVFTPILHHLVRIVNGLETAAITKVAYYQEIREFAQFLVEKNYNVKITGHSLGGGLALIAGAQSRVSAVGISGVNAKLSRDSFYGRHAKPFPVTVEDLDTYTFNVVPKGDPVPMLDDKASLYQNINCTAGANDLLGCHSVVRTICETMYRCGTKFSDMDKYRPVLCECVLQYEYPEPNPLSPNGTATSFRQKCIDTYPNKWNRSAA